MNNTSTRLAWLSDTHLGYRQYGLARRQVDFSLALEGALADIYQQGIRLVLNTGDLLHSNRPGADAMTDVQRIHGWLVERKMVMLVIPGNHDRSLDEHHWIQVVNPGNKPEGIMLLDAKTYCDFGSGLQIYGVGHMARDKFMSHSFPDKVDIIMCHQSVVEFINFESASSLHIAELPLGRARAVLLGDIHITDIRHVNEVLVGYPGSTESNSASEPDKKHWVELTVPKDIGRVDFNLHLISTRPVLRAEINRIEDIADLAARAAKEARPPVIHVEYDALVPGILEALYRELNPDRYVLRPEPKLVQLGLREGSSQPAPGEAADINPEMILRDMIGGDPELYAVAAGLVRSDNNPATVLAGFVDRRLAEIQAAA